MTTTQTWATLFMAKKMALIIRPAGFALSSIYWLIAKKA
jgi:hypothetical protein